MNVTNATIRTSLRLRSVLLAVLALLLSSTMNNSVIRAADSQPGGLLIVANKGEHTMGIIDTVAGKQIATLPEDAFTGHELVASQDGKRAFVPIYGNSGVGHPGTDGSIIRVYDIPNRKLAGTIDFGKGVRPHCAVVNPKSGMIYVTTELENAIAIIDPITLKIVGSVPTDQAESHMLAISSDGRRGYTANVGPGTVSVLDLPAKKVLAVIPVAHVTQRIALSPDDRWAFTADQTKPQLAVIDTKTNAVVRWIPLPGVGYGAAATPDGRWLLIAIPKEKKVAAIDLQSMEVARTFDVPKSPQEVLVRPDGLEAYVSCDASHQVAVLGLQSWSVTKLIDAGAGVDGLAWAK